MAGKRNQQRQPSGIPQGGEFKNEHKGLDADDLNTPPVMPPMAQPEAALPHESGPEETTVDIAQRVMEEYELDYDNGEVFEQDDGVYMTVEAPNHATIGVDFDKDSDEQTILREVADFMDSFDADDEFDELWSREFGEHNHFTPSQFIHMLMEDERFYRETATRLRSKADSLSSQDADTPTIDRLASSLFNYGKNVKETRVVSGMCPDDTIRIDFDDGRIIMGGFDPDYPSCFTFSEYMSQEELDETSEACTDTYDFENETGVTGFIEYVCGGSSTDAHPQ